MNDTIRPFWIFLATLGLSLAETQASLVPAVAQRVDRPAVAAKPVPRPVYTAEQIAGFVEDLGAREFAVREEAMQKLREAGRPAIPALVKGAQAGNLEVTLRAIRILESLYTTGSLEDYEAAETALEKLQQAEKLAVASRARNVLASMGEVREKRAIAAIEELGGIVKSDARQLGFVPNNGGGLDAITTVIIKKNWKGGVEGLAHLEKLRFLQTLYVVEGVIPPVATAQLEQNLQKQRPTFRVQPRGGACLGVGGLGVEGGCEISIVNPGSAAAKAGLRPGDLIVAFNNKRGEKSGEPLDFDRLVALIKELDAGDKVPIMIRRNGREQTVDVVLEEWK